MRGVLGSHLILGGGRVGLCEGGDSAGLDLSRKPFASLAASGFSLELHFAQTSPALLGPGLYLLMGMGTVAGQENSPRWILQTCGKYGIS